MAPLSPADTAPTPYRELVRRTSWTDLRALAWFLLLALVGLGLASVARNATEGFDEDVRSLLSGAPHTIIHIALVALQGAALVLAIATPVALLVRRRPALLARGTLAVVLGALAFLAISRIGFEHPDGGALAPVVAGFGPGPSSVIIAGAAGAVATLRAVVGRVWLAPLWVLVALLALLRTLSAPDAPLDVVLAVGVGGAVGTGVLLALGRSVHELTPAGVAAALAATGIAVRDVRASATPRGPWAFEGESEQGPLLIRVVDEQAWQTDSLDRAYRRLRLRGTGDETAHASPTRAITSEAMITLLAADRGVRVPRVLTVARAPQGEGVLAVERVPGLPLDAVAPEALTDDVLAAAWQQVATLHAARIAHRDLTARHLVVDAGAGAVVVTNLARGEAGVGDDPLAADDAELLASTYALVGPERAVAAALAILGKEPLAAAAARLVPAALSPATRAAVKKVEGGLQPLIDEAARATGVEKPELVAVERFKPRTLVMAAALAVAVYALAPQLANLPHMVTTIEGADWAWLPWILLASVATYVGCALGLAGGTPGRVPVAEAGMVALAGSFVATFSPPGVSTVGLNVRFLQKRGFSMPVAVSASAAKEAAVAVVHIFLLVVFALWAGSSGALTDELKKLPPAHVLILVGLGILAVIGGAVAVPKVRALLRTRVVPALKDAAEAMRPVIASPRKLASLLGGVALLPLGYGVCLWLSLRAFDPSADFVAVVLVSLTAGAVASAAPTPGGIGAVEAVLLAALTAIGMSAAPALAGVLLYRVATFWLPILPGLVTFRVLTAKGVL